MLRMRTPPAGRSALRPRSRGRICSPRIGLKSREMSRGRSPLQAMMSLTATVRSKASLQVTLMGRLFVTSPALGRIRSRQIAQAPSPLRMARVTIRSSPLMAVCSRSCVPTPSLCRRVLNSGGVPSEWESEPLKHKGPGLLTALALPLFPGLIHRNAGKVSSPKFSHHEGAYRQEPESSGATAKARAALLRSGLVDGLSHVLDGDATS